MKRGKAKIKFIAVEAEDAIKILNAVKATVDFNPDKAMDHCEAKLKGFYQYQRLFRKLQRIVGVAQ